MSKSSYLLSLLFKKYIQIISLAGIFLSGLVVRFLFFPDNIYFGYDQARDAFAVREILSGNLKILGPTTSIEGLYHGSLYYYIFAPFYALTSGDPVGVAAFLRILNAVGVIPVYFIGRYLFDKKTGLIAALLYAFSFEQTQYAIYINHPALSVISALIFYLGWVILVFRNKKYGLPLILCGLGFSLQFEFVMVYLLPVTLLLGIIFRKQILSTGFRWWVMGIAGFILSISTYLLAEILYGFRSLQNLSLLAGSASPSFQQITGQMWFIMVRFFTYNIYSADGFVSLTVLIFAVFFYYSARDKQNRSKILFLLIWLLAGLINYSRSYSTIPMLHYGAGASVSLLVFSAFLITRIPDSYKSLALIVTAGIILTNINQILLHNRTGSLPEVNVQSGMLLSNQKKAVDYMYINSGGRPFSVNAVTMPINVNTTWSYLFETHGLSRYGYLPVWGGDAAAGYPGGIPVETARSELPETRFLLIEPTRGVQQYLIDDVVSTENLFSKPVGRESFGEITVEKRVRY